MKFVKLLALGLCMTFGLSSCLNDDNGSENSYQTYTDYLQFNADGTQATTDLDETYSVNKNAAVQTVIMKLTNGRGLSTFRVEYGPDGKMVGGLEMVALADCIILPAEGPKNYEKNGVLRVDASISSVSKKYMNLYTEVYCADKVDPSKLHLCVKEVVGNQVRLTLVYDEPSGKNTVGQAVSFDYHAALAAVCDQLKPIDGKVKIILTNNDNISGDVSWSY